MEAEDREQANVALLLEEKIDARVGEAVARTLTAFMSSPHHTAKETIMASIMTELLNSPYFKEQVYKLVAERLVNRTIY